MEGVLAVLPTIEARSPVPTGGPTRLEVRGRLATNPQRPGPTGPVPFEEIVGEPMAAARMVDAASSATSIRLSKFSSGSAIRARVVYDTPPGFLSMKLVVGERSEQAPVRAAVGVRRAMGALSPLPAPPLIAWGQRRRFAYLLEPLVPGSHPRSVEHRVEVGRGLSDRLITGYDSGAVEQRVPPAHPEAGTHLGDLIGRLGWSPEWPPASEVLGIAAELIPTSRTVPTGWTHGDLVFSNIIANPPGPIIVIDWEYAAIRPVAADLGKLAGSMPGHTGVDAVLERGERSASFSAPGGLTLREQLMRVYLQELSWWEPKRQRAVASGRLDAFDIWARRRMQLLTRVLAA